MSLFDIALHWYHLGLICLPCYKGTKAFLKGCSPKRSKPDLAQIARWFQGDVNIALVTSQANDGRNLVILDFDNVLDFVQWRQECEIETRIDQTRRGFHVYLWVKSDEEWEGKIELRQKGETILLPPSKVRGWQYRTIEDFEIAEMEDLGNLGFAPKGQMGQSKGKKHAKVPQISLTIRGDNNVVFFPYSAPFGAPRQNSIFRYIRSRLSLLDYLKEYEPIQSNDRWYMSYCPAHEDEHRSLSIDSQNQLCSCFKPDCRLHSKAGLDVIGVHAMLRGISNYKAAMELVG